MTTPIEFITQKDMRGNWRAETDVNLEGPMVLRVLTHKNFSGALITSASVHKRQGDFLVHALYSDFHKCMKSAKTRVTAKAVAEQHGEALLQIDQLKEEAEQFYAKKKQSELTDGVSA